MYFAKKQDLKKAEKAAEKENFSQSSEISIGDLKMDVAAAEEDCKEAKRVVEEAKASLASLEAQVTAAFLAEAVTNPSTTTSPYKTIDWGHSNAVTSFTVECIFYDVAISSYSLLYY